MNQPNVNKSTGLLVLRWIRELLDGKPATVKPDKLMEWVWAIISEERRLREEVAEKDAEIMRHRLEARRSCQILVACIGADGPCDADEAAERAVAEIERLRTDRARDVEAAYREGHLTGRCGGGTFTEDYDWNLSQARARLEGDDADN